MNIEKLEIRNFGGLCDKQVMLHSGINVIYGENESGKSTLHAFIRGMFFGMERLRGKGARTDSYNRYEPWSNPACYGGNMEFSCDRRRFRLERNFYKELESVKLFCPEDGEVLSVENGDLTMLLGGIGEAVFDNTVSVGQLKGVTGRELAAELQNYLANNQGSAYGTISPGEAVGTLKKQKRELIAQKKEEEEQNLLRVRELEAKEELLMREQEQCQTRIRTARENLRRREQQSGDIPGSLEENVRTTVWTKIVSLIRRLVARLFPFWAKKSMDFQNPEQGHMGKEEGRLQQMQEEFQERQVLLGNLRQEKEETKDKQYESGPVDEEIEAVELAVRTLEKTVIQIQKKTGSRLNRRTGEILSELTDGKYRRVVMNEQLEIQIESMGQRLALFQLSRGTLEQVYFALRMAVAEVLCSQEELPVILDDVFAMYDERRLVKALQWLYKNKKQVIILTCHKREMELLATAGIPFFTPGVSF